MSIFKKARTLCNKCNVIRDLVEAEQEVITTMQRLSPVVSDTPEDNGPETNKAIRGALESKAAQILFLMAHEDIVKRDGTDFMGPLNKMEIRAELDRYENLIFKNWEQQSDGQALHNYKDADECQLATDILEVVLEANGFKSKNEKEQSDQTGLALPEEVFDVLRQIAARESGRKI